VPAAVQRPGLPGPGQEQHTALQRQQGAAYSWSRQALVRVRAQAALAYDLAAVKFRGRGAATNFDMSAFDAELAQLDEARSPPAPVTHAADVISRYRAPSILTSSAASECAQCPPLVSVLYSNLAASQVQVSTLRTLATFPCMRAEAALVTRRRLRALGAEPRARARARGR
jgi:hypothetical protein